jgi:hypothetical protein
MEEAMEGDECNESFLKLAEESLLKLFPMTLLFLFFSCAANSTISLHYTSC